MGGRVRVSNGADLVDFNPERAAITNEWQDGNPILTDTHVVLTPRDSNELHCLLLKDGSLQWKTPRGEGQYVACIRDGMVFVVNKHSVEAFQLADGKPAWPSPVPITNQTGRGVATNTHLLLPLVNGQVVSIDLKTSVKVYSRVRGADQEPLGNLVPGPGVIVSQTPTELTAFRTLESIYPEALQRLAANAHDSEALAQRGEYRLSVSQTTAGQADLRESLRITPSAGAQFLLFESLLEGLQSDFSAHRNAAVEAEKLARTTTQKSMLYRVWVEGLRKLGESQAAFQLLERLNSADLGRPGMERVDGLHSVRRDYWTRYELRQIIDNSSPADQQKFLASLKVRLDQAKASKSDEDLRRLSHLLGWGSMADQTRLALAERLAAKEYSLEAEHLLANLRNNADPTISGRAIALMITGMIKLERGGEAANLIEELERTHGDIICHGNKTAKQLAAEWRKTVPMNIGSFENWPTGRVEITREVLEKGDIRNNLEIPIEGNRGPFYSDIQLRFESGSEKFLGLSGWSTPRFGIPWSELGPLQNYLSFNAHIKNHIILLGTGVNVVAIDTLTTGKTIRAQQIWSSPLSDRPTSETNQFFQPARARPGIGRLRFADRSQNPIGMVGAVQDDSLCVIRGRHLVLLDILSGETLWKRTDMVPGSEIFGDADTIFVIAPQSPIGPGPVAKKIRRADGAIIGESPVPTAFNRIQCQGKHVLSLSPDPKTLGSFLLKVDDVSLGKTVWETTYNATIQLGLIGDSELAVLEQSGMLTHLRLVDGKPLWTRQLQPSVRRREFAVIAEEKRLLILRDENQPPNFQQQVMAINPTQSTLMYGQVDCVDRATGELLWSHKIEGYGLDLTAPTSSPFWFFSARAVSPQVKLAEIRMLALDKRTGRVALQTAEGIYGHSFEFGLDPKEQLVDITLIGSQQPVRYRLKLTGEAITTAPAVPATPPAPPPEPRREEK
jgi:outer membrane protein assembly factor BamB